MTQPRIRSLTVRGFRAFGSTEQELKLRGNLTVVWAPNSKGKTSLAEAFEFLLTGRIVRRELMASSQDEFADSLRNAHLPDGEDVYVRASIDMPDGTEHSVRRVLTRDYGKRHDCESRLEINGEEATPDQLLDVSFALSQPPLVAPVLAQHTLGYVFSLGPQNRTTYFKALLEVTDLDELRTAIADLNTDLAQHDSERLLQFGNAAQISELGSTLTDIAGLVFARARMDTAVLDASETLILTTSRDVPETLDERREVVSEILKERRSTTFPVDGFTRSALPDWSGPTDHDYEAVTRFIEARDAVDEDTRQLSSLFTETLKLPTVAGATEPIDCPVCDTPSVLTPDRIASLREHVKGTRGFSEALRAVRTVLNAMRARACTLADSSVRAVPRCLSFTPTQRRRTGFTVARLRELLADQPDLVDAWLPALRRLTRASTALKRQAAALQRRLSKESEEPSADLDVERIRDAFNRLADLRADLEAVVTVYETPARDLATALNEILDAVASTTGWQDFLDCTSDCAALYNDLVDRAARRSVQRDIEGAVRDFDTSREKVLDDKFSEYSGLVQEWWERLRPDETTYFASVQPRPGTRRTIDFKAGLATTPARDAPKLRDVIAIFSQSQLHCLGLALFLAKAEHEGFGVVVLDDPVLSSDEDYKVHFNSTVLEKLLDVPMQVVVLTQDHATWEELETRYRHVGIANAQLFIESPAEGTVIENTSDALLAKLSRARSLARGGHPDLRKECGVQLRDAGERFCKEMLVAKERADGKAAASLCDYDGKTLEWLCPHIEPLLDKDASHPGKLGVFKKTVNDACHDNVPPGNEAMTVACGDIRFFVKQYLGR